MLNSSYHKLKQSNRTLKQKVSLQTRFMPFAFSIVCVFAISQNLYAIDDEKETSNNAAQTTSNDSVQTRNIDAVITSSTGFDLPIKDEAKNVILIGKDKLENKGFGNLEQALQRNPIVNFADVGFGKVIDLRGQGFTQNQPNQGVKVLVNRVPITQLDTSHSVPPFNNIDIDDIESIEIIPGGGAVVYGSGTRGGEIKIVTKMPSKDFMRSSLKFTSGERLGLQGGSANLAVGKKISDNLFLKGNASFSYVPGTRNTEGYAIDDPKKHVDAFNSDNQTNLYTSFQTLYHINETSKLDFNINYSRLWITLPDKSLSFDENKTQSELQQDRFSPAAVVKNKIIETLQTSANYTAKFNNIDFDALLFYQFSFDNTKPTKVRPKPDYFYNHGGGANLKAKHTLENNTLMVGLDNLLEYSNKRLYISDIHNKYRYTSAYKLTNSLYTLDMYKFNNMFDISGGARIEYANYWIDSNMSHDITPHAYDINEHTQRLGYAAELTPNFKYSDTGNAYAKAELGFISPSSFQMLNVDNDTEKQSLNNLRPEQYITAEIGFKDEFDWSYIQATLFYTYTFDEIYTESVGWLFKYSNIGNTVRAGLEFAASQELFDTAWLRLNEGLNLLYTEILSADSKSKLKGSMIPLVPWLKANIGIEADVLSTDSMLLTLFFNNIYTSQSIDKSKAIVNQDGYVLSDLGLVFSYKDLVINAGIKNLFDSFYTTYQFYPSYIPGFGRSYYAEVKYTF